MKVLESILWIIVLICMSAIAILSVVIWHDFVIAGMLIIGILIWIANIKEIFK